MWLIDKIAEQRILEAREKGEFDNLAGSGKPIQLGDDNHVPEILRAGFRILKNAGYLPSELQARKEIANVQQLLLAVDTGDAGAVRHLNARLNYLLMKANISHAGTAICENGYYEKLRRKAAVLTFSHRVKSEYG
jgi:hypothetical protein